MDSSVVDIVDRDGWHREFPLDKAMIWIGSDSRNDVVLDASRGGGVAARHLQLISVSHGPGYRLVNMGDSPVLIGPNAEVTLAPRGLAEVMPGEKVRVGEFTLTFQGGPRAPGMPAGALSDRETTSACIGLTLTLPGGKLGVDDVLDGSLVIRNLGDKTGVQFVLEPQGVDPAAVEIGPAPILFPGAEKEVYFRVRHPRAPMPAAGQFRFRIRATAPAAYPGESATASALVQLAPYYQHEMRLIMA
jgi:hypothetical protein